MITLKKSIVVFPAWAAMRFQLLLVCCLALFGCVAGQHSAVDDPLLLPQIGGTLTADRTLNGTYLLTNDLQVPAGITLTIKPGSTIYIQPSDSTKIDPEFLSREVEILVRGRLRAVGTETRPITFKPVTQDADAILWSGLQLVTREPVQLEHVIVEQAEVGVLCLNASPEIHSLHVRRSRYGIILQQQSAPIIVDSLLIDGEAGLFCWDQSAPQVSNCWIMHHQEEGIYLGPECRGAFSSNLIKGNDRGIVLPDNSDFDSSNRVAGNRQDFLRYTEESR